MNRRTLFGVLFLIIGCAQQEPFLVRGNLDRTNWVVHICDSEQSYRVIFTSNQAPHFDKLEADAGATDPSLPVIFEFYASPLGAKLPWQELETVGVGGPMSLEQGKCARST